MSHPVLIDPAGIPTPRGAAPVGICAEAAENADR